jgi:site-specific DNA-methyltransferase (adenine-specific)
MSSPVIIGNTTLHNCECMEFMRGVPDKEFDLAIVDPQYGIKQDGHRENNRSKLAVSTEFHKALWDQDMMPVEYYRELERISVNQIIWGGNHLAGHIGKNSPCWIVWDKHTTGGFADCELAYTSFKTAVRKFDYPWNGMIQGFHGSKSKNQERIHPTQKPIQLYEWLLANYAKPGHKIFDSHLGSGSHAIACNNLGFELVACEKEAEYFQGACAWIRREAAQFRLFA